MPPITLFRHAIAALSAAAILNVTPLAAASSPPDTAAPRYDAAGRMLPPTDYRTWIFLSSGIDMSYSQSPAMASGHVFNNVFVPQAAYAAFTTTGTWPDKTILLLENRGGAGNISINKRGLVQTGTLMGMEAHVKDTARFKGGWGFFDFDGDKPATLIPASAACYACHQAHGAVDTTFVQFYPTILPIATQHATLSPAYLADQRH
ncbi:MAG TPA: cytochrome P460 family protein [Acetobacteraceae bacterium]|nr:cytochrome P460 family protein [Acetobacteraceae bacterium]